MDSDPARRWPVPRPSDSLNISPRARWVVCPLGRTRGHWHGRLVICSESFFLSLCSPCWVNIQAFTGPRAQGPLRMTRLRRPGPGPPASQCWARDGRGRADFGPATLVPPRRRRWAATLQVRYGDQGWITHSAASNPITFAESFLENREDEAAAH